MAGSSAPETQLKIAESAITGMSLLLIVSYAPFVIATALEPRLSGMPIGVLVGLIFLSMAIGTLWSAYSTGLGLVVAPAVGMATFVQAVKPETISTRGLLIATLVAGFISVLLTLLRGQDGASLRKKLLDVLPRPVKVGVRGGIGALLAVAAIHSVQDVRTVGGGKYFSAAVAMFVVAVVVLLVSDFLQSKLRHEGKATVMMLFARVFYVLVPLIILSLLYSWGAFQKPSLQLPSFPHQWPLLGSDPNELGRSRDVMTQVLAVVAFAILIGFIFLTDIPGSPYDILHRSKPKEAEINEKIEQSFRVTSWMSTFNPFVNLFTSVYYAENYVVIRENDADSSGQPRTEDHEHPGPAWVCGILFLACAVFFACVQFPFSEMKTWLSLSVAPALFCVGIRITARALHKDFVEAIEEYEEQQQALVEQQKALAQPQQAPAPQRQAHAQQEKGETQEPKKWVSDPQFLSTFFVPVSLTVVLTHIIGFELALPIGILYYSLAVIFSQKKWYEVSPSLLTLVGSSLVVAGLVGLVRFQALGTQH